MQRTEDRRQMTEDKKQRTERAFKGEIMKRDISRVVGRKEKGN